MPVMPRGKRKLKFHMVLSFLNPDTLVIDSFSPKDSCYLLVCLVLRPESLVCQFGGGLGFPDSSVGKESTCNAGDLGLIPGLGRFLGEGNGNPLQCSCLENPRDGGAWWAAISGVAESRT